MRKPNQLNLVSCEITVHRGECAYDSLRILILLFLLSISALPLGADAACIGGGGTDAAPLVSVDHLRSYRAGFGGPARLAIDTAGNVYVSDPVNGRVVARRPDGKILFEFDGLNFPVSLAVGGDGTVYIGDGDTGRIDAYDQDGQLLWTFGQGDGEFSLPNDIAIDPGNGDLLIADAGANLIKRYSMGGQLIGEFGGVGTNDGQFDFPASLAVSSSEIFVIDQRNSRIQVFDLSGNFLFCVDSENQIPVGGFAFCDGFFCGDKRRFDQGIWVDTAGRIYVVDSFEGSIYVMGRNGVIVSGFGGLGTGSGKLRTPTDLVIDGSGRAYVASSAGAALEIFGIDNFTDREMFVPGRFEILTDPLDLAVDQQIVSYLEIPGYRLDQVDPNTIIANSFVAPDMVSTGDYDNDGVPDLELRFGQTLLQTLPANGTTTITVRGALGSLMFEESDVIDVTSPGAVDTDGDGVPDQIDFCGDTAPDVLVTPDGCSIAQRCPCEVQDQLVSETDKILEIRKLGAELGELRRCLVRVANELQKSDQISAKEKGQLLKNTRRHGCNF